MLGSLLSWRTFPVGALLLQTRPWPAAGGGFLQPWATLAFPASTVPMYFLSVLPTGH